MDEKEIHEKMAEAYKYAALSQCRRRQVGCTIYDGYGDLLGAGCNIEHIKDESCLQTPCKYHADPDSPCLTVHAEIEALLEVEKLTRVMSVFVTTQPCFSCAKALTMSSVRYVYYHESIKDRRSLEILGDRNVKAIQVREFNREGSSRKS